MYIVFAMLSLWLKIIQWQNQDSIQLSQHLTLAQQHLEKQENNTTISIVYVVLFHSQDECCSWLYRYLAIKFEFIYIYSLSIVFVNDRTIIDFYAVKKNEEKTRMFHDQTDSITTKGHNDLVWPSIGMSLGPDGMQLTCQNW